MNNRSSRQARRKALEFFAVYGIVTLFLLFLSIPFGRGIGTILVVLAAIVTLGVIRRKKPELFSALKKKTDALPEDEDRLEAPPSHTESHRAYVMLIGLNASSPYRITINESPFVIGNSDDVNYKVRDEYVSKRHISIEYDPNSKERLVTDISRNGSFLNGQALQKGVKRPLRHGDTLQIGRIAFSVEFVHF